MADRRHPPGTVTSDLSPVDSTSRISRQHLQVGRKDGFTLGLKGTSLSCHRYDTDMPGMLPPARKLKQASLWPQLSCSEASQRCEIETVVSELSAAAGPLAWLPSLLQMANKV